MHSRRMRTTHFSGHLFLGLCLPRGVSPVPGRCLSRRGVCLGEGGSWCLPHTPSGQTDTCAKNLPCPKLCNFLSILLQNRSIILNFTATNSTKDLKVVSFQTYVNELLTIRTDFTCKCSRNFDGSVGNS